HTGSSAIHHESDCAGGGENCDLGVAVAKFFAVGEGFVPAGFGGFVEAAGDVVFVDVVDRGTVHTDDVEERLAVDVPAGASGSGSRGASLRLDGAEPRPHTSTTKVGFCQAFFCGFGGVGERLTEFGDAGGLQIGFAAHDRCDAGGVIAAGVRVVRQTAGHEQRAEIGVAQAERAVVVRVAHDHL